MQVADGQCCDLVLQLRVVCCRDRVAGDLHLEMIRVEMLRVPALCDTAFRGVSLAADIHLSSVLLDGKARCTTTITPTHERPTSVDARIKWSMSM